MEKAGMDEKYCMWYICPKCGDDNIAASFNYCPNCGKDLSQCAKNTEQLLQPDNSRRLSKC